VRVTRPTVPRTALLAPFGIAGFGPFWLSSSFGSCARTMTQLALGWLTLQATDSPFLVGAVGAARMAPQLVLGIPSGVVADRFDRRTLLIVVNGASTLALVALMVAALVGTLSFPVLLVAAAIFGVLDTLRTATAQAYAYDLVQAAGATSGLALTNLGGQLFGLVGGLAGGWTLGQLGGPAAFGFTGLILLGATVALLVAGRRAPDAAPAAADQAADLRVGHSDAAPAAADQAADLRVGHSIDAAAGPPVEGRPARPSLAPRARPNFVRAATLLLRNRLLAFFAFAIIVAEILGFSTQTLLPTFARDVFDVGAEGLGTMTAVRSAGGVLALVFLAWLGIGGRSGQVFVGACAMLGVALALFAVAPSYALALPLLALSGAAAAAMDTLGQTLLQRNADERERGAAMGIWVFAVGFGPFGHLALGWAAGLYGAPATQLASGAMLIVVGALLAASSSLRRAH